MGVEDGSSPEAQRKPRFVALFEAYYDYSFHSLRRLGVADADVEDVLHDMFMMVYQKLDQLDATRPAKPWLFAFAVRFASDYRRLARHRVTGGDRVLATLPGGASPEEDASRAQATSLAMRALGELSLEVRSVFIAYELDEIPMKDIAVSMGIPVNTAYSRLRLAREQFGTACATIRVGPQ